MIGVSQAAEDPTVALARILANKGAITSADLARIEAAAGGDRVSILTSILANKGVLTSADLAQLAPTDGKSTLVPAQPSSTAAQTAAPQPAVVVAESKSPVTIYGSLLLNAFSDTSTTNNQDIPQFAGKQGSDNLGNDKSFGMTARQSRFGLKFSLVGGICGSLIRSNGGGSPVRSAREPVRASALCRS